MWITSYHAVSVKKMVRLSMANPFKSDSRNDKKRKLRHADRYAEERRTLEALKQGNYSAPIAVVYQGQAESDNNHSDVLGHEAHEEPHSGYQSTSQVDPNAVLSAWASIPWDVLSSSNPIQPSQSRFPLLDPNMISAAENLLMFLGQQRVQMQYCDCMPRCVQVLANGFLASSPLEPSAAFSMRLLAYHNYAWHHSNVRMKPFAETQRVFSEERSEFLWNRNMTGCLTKTVWLYRELLTMGIDLVQETLQLTDTQKLAYGTCPACFGHSSGTGLYQLPSVRHRLILLLDGNFQLQHHKQAGRQSAPLVTPEIFVQPSELEAVKEYITHQERLHKITKKADKCADSHKAGNDNRNETTWKACDDTGIMGSCCRHDSVVFLANIHGTGENRALPLAILKRFLAGVEEDRPVGVLYDLGCSLDKYIDLRKIWPESRDRLRFGTSVFHAYVHEWPCQVKYNPRYQQGWGLSDGESLERLWSLLAPLHAGWLTCHSCLAAKKFEQALLRRDLEKAVISELVQTHNPNATGPWEDQVRVALEKKNDTEDQQKMMTEFLDNEEVLESYR
ncbi:hypothetical protein PSTT_08278 [Puccinia striiformis]|uniref:CxC1-like cysteine cluster associated with KDZ transposases domain-containing protein n=1 Tax=Puccinia striiformis TaxID=27350 RepID=A0A2S4VDB3_9BASI|nr:hypothetical protein PSTT_08278 [Puccinia striiformis]